MRPTRRALALERLRNQHLIGPRFDDPVEAVRWFCAVQSQDYHGAKWALAQRTNSAGSAALDELFNRGGILRTHVMRPTWHFVAPGDIRWLLGLTAPRVQKVMAIYNRKLELDDAVLRRSVKVIAKALTGGKHLHRGILKGVLEDAGISTSGTRLSHILMYAELDAIICSGPLEGKKFTYALLEERVPPAEALTREEALAKLARRYFESHGPATVQDFSWWSGLRMGDAREGIEAVRGDLAQETFAGVRYWLAPSSSPVRAQKPVLHLLPNYDEHIVAYRDHGPSFDPVSLGGVKIRPEALMAYIVTRDGFVIGGWKRSILAKRAEIRTDMLVSLDARETRALAKAAEEYGRFVGLPVVMDGRDLRSGGGA